ncbi:MAG TPA: hypothetical protein VNZ26_06550 [Vicinamibacterales bacterium]|jgi:hypothetical protein|nr:hypothetical protein [Vicinamibacterales bacterium]
MDTTCELTIFPNVNNSCVDSSACNASRISGFEVLEEDAVRDLAERQNKPQLIASPSASTIDA